MSEYAVGIDLGTTNSALAYRRTADDAAVELLAVPQLVAPATVEARPSLPSFLYVATAEEAGAGVCDLPWARGHDFAVGEWARHRSAEAPARTLVSAKSWLCNVRVDRRGAILPWRSPEEVPKLSPVEVSRRVLEHLAAAWNVSFPGAPLAEQHVVLTVPASFDAGARELTREAALDAGLGEGFVLLEEPQAAVYAWIEARGEDWRRDLREGGRVLVVDVGGGTSDFTLLGVEARDGELELHRRAVGEHILVGGDNMDLALAHLAQQGLAEKGVEIDAWQAVGLWHACRAAKETLLAAGGAERHPVSVLGRGRRLIGGTVSVELEREAVATSILDGFLPIVDAGAVPARRRASGFRELGLAYEQDAAITRHLAYFLRRHGALAAGEQPTHLLLNGGVFKAPVFGERLGEVLGRWLDAPPRPLAGTRDLDFAVARGAASYAYAKHFGGVRIRGGAARSYYVGIESSGLAVPGAPRPLRALCVVPQGMEEGTAVDVPGGELGLVLGETVPFRFFSSTVRSEDRPGDVLDRWNEDELSETDSREATLPPPEDAAGDVFVPVRLRCELTELGLLALWCHATTSEGRWKMELRVRDGAFLDEGTGPR